MWTSVEWAIRQSEARKKQFEDAMYQAQEEMRRNREEADRLTAIHEERADLIIDVEAYEIPERPALPR